MSFDRLMIVARWNDCGFEKEKDTVGNEGLFFVQKKWLIFLIAAMLLVQVAVPVYGETFDDRYYTVVSDIKLQQLISSSLLKDGTFLLTGMADNAGICFMVDQQCHLIHQYRIDAPKASHSVTVRGPLSSDRISLLRRMTIQAISALLR